MASEIMNNKTEAHSKITCNSHGSAAPYDLDRLKRCLLAQRWSEGGIDFVSPRKASSSSDCSRGKYAVLFPDCIFVM